MADRNLLVRILGDSRSVERAFAQSTRSANTFGTSVEGTGKKMDRASKNMASFAKGAAAGFAGAAAVNIVVSQLSAMVSAAAESEQVLGQTRVALEATGNSWADYGKQIEDVIAAQSKLGFDDEELLKTFSLFVRATDDVTQSLEMNALAMDIARARFIDLEAAANIVNKAALGNAGALRRMGIAAEQGSTGVELLTMLQEKFGGSAEAASGDAATAMDRFKVSAENAQEAVGTLLLPIVGELANNIATLADTVQIAVDGLGALGRVKIPVIEVPLKFAFQGGPGSLGFLENLLPGPLKEIVRFQKLRKEAQARAAADESAAQQRVQMVKTFEDNFIGFTEGLELGAKRAAAAAKRARDGVAAFGEKGFKPLVKSWMELQQDALAADLERLDLGLTRAGITEGLADDVVWLERIANILREAIKKGVDVAKNAKALAVVIGQIGDAKRAMDAEKQAAAAQRAADFIAGLELGVSQAANTKGLQDDLDALLAVKKGLEKLIASGRDVLANQERLETVIGQIAAKREEINRAAETSVERRQFLALGFTAEGERRLPSIKNLQKQADALGKRLAGTPLAKKFGGWIDQIGKVLAGKFGKVGDNMKQTIIAMLEDIRDAFKQSESIILPAVEALNTGKILKGLGLSPEEIRKLRGRLSGFSEQGLTLSAQAKMSMSGAIAQTGPTAINLENVIVLDGAVIGRSTKRYLANDSIHNPRQKRGPNAGR